MDASNESAAPQQYPYPPVSAIRAVIRTALLAGAIGATVALALTTLGVSLWLALVAGLALPVIGAWLALCGTLEAHEPAIDAMLDDRAATLRTTVAAMRSQSAPPAYTGDTVKLDEV